MNVCLIIPPSGFLIDERVFPSLGVLKVGAALEQAGHEVHLLDLSGDAKYLQTVAEQLQAYARWPEITHTATVYGITATMPQMPAACAIARTIREGHPAAHLILGGPHPTLLHASAKRGMPRAMAAFTELAAQFDTVVCGDGERAIFQALQRTGVIDADDPASELFLTKAHLTEAPLPARHLIDLPSYRYQIDGHKTTSLIAQLGCPFGCNFCGGRRSPFLRRVRMRSTDAVIAELEHLHVTYGYTGFMFLDDELNVNPQFMPLLEAIIALQEKHGVEFRLRGLVKSELVTAPMAARMYQAGFRQLLIGFESGDERMLLNMNKHATKDDNTRCVERLTTAGIKVKALMSFGHPGEDEHSVYATEQWLRQVHPHDFDVTIITVYPGTPYYEDAVEQTGYYTYTAKSGDRLHMVDVDQFKDVNFYKGMPGNYRSFVWTDALSREGLVACRDEVEQGVRYALDIPWPTTAAEKQYEHSMGAR